MIFIDLAMNLSMLVALSIVSSFVNSSISERWRGRSIVQGLLFGFVAVAGMLKPFVLVPGVFFDGRSVVLSICAVFFGPFSAVIASGMAAVCRICIGGGGTMTGVLVLVSSSAIGLFFHFLKNRNKDFVNTRSLLCLGYSVHIAMILLMLTLPLPVALKTIKNISAPVLLFFPLATVLIGKILSDQETRKDFIKALAESEQKYRHIIETANEGIWILDSRQAIIYANSKISAMLDYSNDEMIGRLAGDFIYDTEYKPEITGETTVHSSQVRERQLIRKNGDILWAMISTSPVIDDPGNPGGSFAMIADITGIKAAEQALEKERNLFIGGPSIVFIWKNQADWPVEYVSKNVINHLGYTPDDFISGRYRFADFVHPDDWEEVDSFALSMLSTPGVENYTQTYRMKSAEGRYIWFNDFTIVVRNHRNEITLLHGYLTNISDRIAAEEALRESEARLRTIFENSPVGIAQSRDGIVLDSNPAYLKMLGYNSIDEILYSPIKNQVAESQREKISEIIRKRASGMSVESTYEIIGLKRDGTEFPCLVSANRIMLDGGPLTISFFTDLTEQKKLENERLEMERKLLHTQKLESLGILAGGIAHDFNNLLMAILGHADLALSGISPVSPVRPQLEEIIIASRRAADLCRQMLAYSGKGRFIIERIILRDVIDEMIHLLKTCISKKAIINLNLEKNLPLIEGDPGQIRQLVMNLVINASEAIGEKGGVITISTGSRFCDRMYLQEGFIEQDLEEGLYVSLEVSDTGCGMTRDIMDRIFEPFFTTKFTGRGLGMSAVLGIVRGHKGAIRIYSEQGQGTTFRVLFPAIDILEEEIKTISGDHDAVNIYQGSGQVLLVDDEEAVLAVAGRMLQVFGYTVVNAKDGCEALEKYSEHDGDFVFVLIDLTMPRMNGEEVFRELRRRNPDLPVIISSGYSENEIAPRFAGKKLAGFIQKPYRLASLHETIIKSLSR